MPQYSLRASEKPGTGPAIATNRYSILPELCDIFHADVRVHVGQNSGVLRDFHTLGAKGLNSRVRLQSEFALGRGVRKNLLAERMDPPALGPLLPSFALAYVAGLVRLDP